jgi:hypothetical protein
MQFYMPTNLHIFVIIWVLVNLNICSSRNRGLWVTVHSSCPLLIYTILPSVGNWPVCLPTEWTFWEAFRNLVPSKAIFCSFNVCSVGGLEWRICWGNDTDQFQLFPYVLRESCIERITLQSGIIVSLCITWESCIERITLQSGIRDADVYHRWGHSVNLLASLVSHFRYSCFDSFLTQLSMKTFAFLRLKSQLVLPSILLLFRGLYFETTIGCIGPILGSHLLVWNGDMIYKQKQTPWPESANELYRLSDRRLLAKLVPTLAYRGCHVVSVTDPYGRILGFLDRSRYFFLSISSSIIFTELSGPRSRPTTSQKMW